MYTTSQKEEFSKAWVHVLASVSGYKVLRADVDDDSIDIELAGNRSQGTRMRAPHLDVQLKCTETDDGQGDHLDFQLKIKNYDDLRALDRHVPALLIVLCVPKELGNWLQETAENTVMRRLAYWHSLAGSPATENETKISVKIPRIKRFTVDSLRQIMERVGAGEQL